MLEYKTYTPYLGNDKASRK